MRAVGRTEGREGGETKGRRDVARRRRDRRFEVELAGDGYGDTDVIDRLMSRGGKMVVSVGRVV